MSLSISQIGLLSLGLAAAGCDSLEEDVSKQDTRGASAEVSQSIYHAAILSLLPFNQCGEEDDFFALDIDHDGIRDSLDSEKEVFCAGSERLGVEELGYLVFGGEAVVRAEQLGINLLDRTAFNLSKTVFTADESGNMASFLLAKGVFTDLVQAKLAVEYMAANLKDMTRGEKRILSQDLAEDPSVISFRENYESRYSRRDENNLLNGRNLLNGFRPTTDRSKYNGIPGWALAPGREMSVEITNGVLTLTVETGDDIPDFYSGQYQADLMPWDGNPEEKNVKVGGSELFSRDLVAIPAPTCINTDWSWERLEDDQFDPKQDLDFQYQSGMREDHAYMHGLAEILPSNWNIAAMPAEETGVAMELMFDNCCDFSPENWVRSYQEAFGLDQSTIIATASRGGFLVLRESGAYGFEPGKKGHLAWEASTKTVVSGREAVRLEFSRDEDPQPQFAETRNTLVRRGNPNSSENYWNERDAWTDEVIGENNWCLNTVPAGMAAMEYLIGDAPFWISEGSWGGMQRYEGSDRLQLMRGEFLEDGGRFYQVRFSPKE